MEDEFKLCWKNFQDNIASGFQNLYDRGDLVDVTLACDGKLLHAHKIVLAICSPYFQEIFITNPCKHPIIILKDVTFNIMCELLEFMYQGVVNVKHIELQSFMKVGQMLQIKGLASNPSSSSNASTSSDKSNINSTQNLEQSNENDETIASKTHLPSDPSTKEEISPKTKNSKSSNSNNSTSADRSHTPEVTSPALSPLPFAASAQQQQQQQTTTPNFKHSSDSVTASLHHSLTHAGSGSGSNNNSGLKRQSDYGSSDALPVYSRKHMRRSAHSLDHSSSDLNESNADNNMEQQINPEDFFMPAISMVESRYDIGNVNVKREIDHHGSHSSTSRDALRNVFGPGFGFDYNMYKNNANASSLASGNSNSSAGAHSDYANDMHMPSDYSKNFGNHMDIPPIAPGEHWFQGKLEFMLSQRGKPLLVHDGHTFGIQYVRKDKKYWQCNLSRKFNCKARVTTTDTGEIIVTNNEHCHTEIRQHLRKDYQRNKVMMNALINLSTNRYAENIRRQNAAAVVNSLSHLGNLHAMVSQSATAVAGNGAAGVLNSSHHHQQQQHLHHNAHLDAGVEHKLFDLGKIASHMSDSNDSTPSPTPKDAHSSQQLQQHQQPSMLADDDAPLDCGIRSNAVATAQHETKLQQKLLAQHAEVLSNSLQHDDNNPLNEWQTKKENSMTNTNQID